MAAGPDHASVHHTRTVVHIEAECFFAQVEILRDPTLQDKPVGILQKDLVITCNYNAREYGVTTLMPVALALLVCPELVLKNGEDLTNYRTMSDKITELLQTRFSPLVERLALNGNYVDISKLVEERAADADDFEVEGKTYELCEPTDELAKICNCGCDKRMRIGSHIARDMRKAIFEELGLTTCAGISYNKMLAKIICGENKVDQQTTLFSWQVLHLILNLPGGLQEIPGIGESAISSLNQNGIMSITDLHACSLSRLEKIFTTRKKALQILNLSFGIDSSSVKQSEKHKSYSVEDAVTVCTLNEFEVKARALATRLLNLLISQNEVRRPMTIRLSIRRTVLPLQWRRESRQMPMFHLPLLSAKNFVEYSVDRMMPLLTSLLAKMVDCSSEFEVTSLNVALLNFNERNAGSRPITSFFQPAPKRAKKDEGPSEPEPSGSRTARE